MLGQGLSLRAQPQLGLFWEFRQDLSAGCPWEPSCPIEGLPPASTFILSRTWISWFNSSPAGRAILRDFVGNLLPQRLLKQKLQSLTHIASTKAFRSHGERGPGGTAELTQSMGMSPFASCLAWLHGWGRFPHARAPLSPPECRELVLQAALPVLQELIQAGEEEEACIELLSSILEVLYQAQKVNQELTGQIPLSGVKHQFLTRMCWEFTAVSQGTVGVTMPAETCPEWGKNLVLSTSGSFWWVARHPHEWGRGFQAQG